MTKRWCRSASQEKWLATTTHMCPSITRYRLSAPPGSKRTGHGLSLRHRLVARRWEPSVWLSASIGKPISGPSSGSRSRDRGIPLTGAPRALARRSHQPNQLNDRQIATGTGTVADHAAVDTAPRRSRGLSFAGHRPALPSTTRGEPPARPSPGAELPTTGADEIKVGVPSEEPPANVP